MQALDPIAVAVGDTDVYVDLSGSTQPYKAVILYNASPLVIGVTSGPQSVYLQPNSTIVVPASTSTGKVLMNVIGSTSSATSGDVYPTILWLNDQVPTSLGSSPLTEVSLASGTTVDISGPVSVYTGGTDLVSTQSKASAVSESLTPAAGGGTASATVTIPTSPVMHAALVSGVYSITAASNQSIQIQVVGNNTNTLYYNFDNLTTNVTNQAIPEAVIAISAADTALVVSHVSGGGTQSSTINLNFYSQAIPPDPYLAALVTQGLFGTTAETVINPLVSPPLLQSVYNNQVSTNSGIKIADALAPADTYANPQLTTSGFTDVYTAPASGVILRQFTLSELTPNSGEYLLSLGGSSGPWVSSVQYVSSTNLPFQFPIPAAGIYIQGGGTLTFYTSSTPPSPGYRASIVLTTL